MAVATYPQPTGGELVIDRENNAIHGVALIGPWSRNDGSEIDASAHSDFRDLINDSPDPFTVQYYHGAAKTFDSNGGIVNAYVDGGTLRGTHLLNSAKETTAEILENAEKFKANLCYSFESFERDLTYTKTANGRKITGAKGLRWFALGRECGTTRGMNKTIRGETMSTAKKPTLEQLKAKYPEHFDTYADTVRAETSSVDALAEKDAKIADLEDKLTEAATEVALLKANEITRQRLFDLREQWSNLMEGVDIELLPDTDPGKRIAALAVISDEEFAELAAKTDEADATKKLVERVDTIKNNLVIAETYREPKGETPKPTRLPAAPTGDEPATTLESLLG